MTMLSRALVRAAVARPSILARWTSTSSANAAAQQQTPANAPEPGFDIFANEKNPQRDLVNFPRRSRPIEMSPVRHMWIPEEFFQFFHSKTGVTGPYMFGAGFLTFLCSKEIWVLEHEFYTGLALIMTIAGIRSVAGEDLYSVLKKNVDERDETLDSIRLKEIARCKDAIAEEEKAQWMGTSYEDLIQAKKENVSLQLEAEYRSRLHQAYSQVKRRLDYQLQTANVIRSNEQRHMVNWIISNVRKSITGKQEDDAMKKCVADLKALA